MKPRQQVTSLTLEDLNILLQLALRAEPNHDGKLMSYLRVVVPSDRRDAELMNWAQTIRRIRDGGYRMTAPLDDQVYAWQENVHHCGGDITRFV